MSWSIGGEDTRVVDESGGRMRAGEEAEGDGATGRNVESLAERAIMPGADVAVAGESERGIRDGGGIPVGTRP